METFESQDLQAHIYTEMSILDIARWKIEEHLMADQDYDDPFFVCDVSDVIAKDRKWQELLPAVEAFYAVKCNPDPVILKLLVGLNRSFDCASKREIELVLEAGARPDQIIYAHPCKQTSHLRYAKEKGVGLMTVDSMDELHKIKRVYPEAKLVMRMKYDDPNAVYKLGSKFGCPPEDIPGLMQLAKTLELAIIGISFHVGCGAYDPTVFDGAISRARPLFDTGRDLGHDMKLLDIGGGYPGKNHPNNGLQQFAEVINESLKQHYPPGCGIRVIAEPGTFYVQSAVHLVANVIATRDAENDCLNDANHGIVKKHDKLTKHYYLNTGVFNSFNALYTDPKYFEPPHPVKKGRNDVHLYPSCIWGPTCDATDCLFPDCMLPVFRTGDYVIFENMGAYVYSVSSDFNGFAGPKSHYIAPREFLPILRKIFQDRLKE